MSDDVTAEALRMACLELAARRGFMASLAGDGVPEADVDDVVQEMLEKARGFGSEEA